MIGEEDRQRGRIIAAKKSFRPRISATALNNKNLVFEFHGLRAARLEVGLLVRDRARLNSDLLGGLTCDA